MPYSIYVSLLCDIIDKEPSNNEEAVGKKEWKYAMIEEHQSIMKNDVWDVVPRPEGKSVVTSKWIYKIKHSANGSIEKCKASYKCKSFFIIYSFFLGEATSHKYFFMFLYATICSMLDLVDPLGSHNRLPLWS